MMLSDDDALVHDALARFADEHRRHGAEFLFCNLAEYRDRSFLGPQQNTVNCRPFSGTTRQVSTEEFLRTAVRVPAEVRHASERLHVRQQRGRAGGAALRPVLSDQRRRVFRLAAGGRVLQAASSTSTPRWSSSEERPSRGAPPSSCRIRAKQQIQKMIADAAQNRDWVPLTNFTLSNLMAEGMLLGKQMFPDELRPFPFDEQQYLRRTMKELSSRQAMGVDVESRDAGAPRLRGEVSVAEGRVAGAREERPDRVTIRRSESSPGR